MNKQDVSSKIPPLEVLFEKPKICDPKISPNGRYLVWLERDPIRKVLNFQASIFDAKIGLPSSVNHKQLSYFDDYDACVFYTISTDDKYLIFLREPKLGKEMYHLYTIDISQAIEDETWSYSSWKYVCRTPEPSMTCSIGFVGGIQLWLSKNNPDVLRLATGQGALFWDLSEIKLSTNELKLIKRNPVQLGSWSKNPIDCVNLLCVIFRTFWNIAGSCIFEKIFGVKNIFAPARVPVEWQLDEKTLEVRGKMEVSVEVPKSDSERRFDVTSWIPDVHISMSCLSKSEWKCVDTIAMEDLNMHLVGAGGGSGTARMDFIDEYTVDVHGCKKGDEFTRYERFDLRDVTNSRTIAQAIDSDITGFMRNPNTNSIDAVIYESDRIRISPLVSPEDDNCYERLENAFQSRLITHASKKTVLPSFYPVSRTSDNKIWVVYAYADKGNTICDNCPEAYFIFKNEATTREHLSLWKVRRPLLKSFYGSLGTQHTLHVKSRDGKTLLCFLTLPPPNMINDDELLPLVVFPHGGPNWRDQWGYDPMLQALATQGYVVLQVEFRGSTGFGMKFMKDGMQGGCCSSTQRDIVDSVHFVLDNIVNNQPENQQAYIKINNENCNDANGIRCDPNRVAILGGSFGGYCALFGVTLLDSTQPKFQYCCGVAFAALYSVGAAGAESFRGDPLVKSYQRKLYGQKISDELDAARAVSPFFHVDKVNVPLMISHGENDPRCPIDLANIFCGKLSERGLVRYITYKDEGHGLRKEGNILQNWKEVLKFLSKRLGKPNSVINHETGDNEQVHLGKIIYYEN